jgi:hypothetical protein
MFEVWTNLPAPDPDLAFISIPQFQADVAIEIVVGVFYSYGANDREVDLVLFNCFSEATNYNHFFRLNKIKRTSAVTTITLNKMK